MRVMNRRDQSRRAVRLSQKSISCFFHRLWEVIIRQVVGSTRSAHACHESPRSEQCGSHRKAMKLFLSQVVGKSCGELFFHYTT